MHDSSVFNTAVFAPQFPWRLNGWRRKTSKGWCQLCQGLPGKGSLAKPPRQSSFRTTLWISSEVGFLWLTANFHFSSPPATLSPLFAPWKWGLICFVDWQGRSVVIARMLYCQHHILLLLPCLWVGLNGKVINTIEYAPKFPVYQEVETAPITVPSSLTILLRSRLDRQRESESSKSPMSFVTEWGFERKPPLVQRSNCWIRCRAIYDWISVI